MQNEKMKHAHQFEVMDHTSGKKQTLLSQTDLGDAGTRRTINIRNKDTGRMRLHDIEILSKGPVQITLPDNA